MSQGDGAAAAPLDAKVVPVMREAVFMVQMVCFRRLNENLAGRHREMTVLERARLAGAVVNNLFATIPEDPEVERYGAGHRALVEQELRGLASSCSDLLPLLTDALRMKTICDNQEGIHSIGSLLMARSLGILEEHRALPLPSTFMLSVRALAAAEGLVEPMQQGPAAEDPPA